MFQKMVVEPPALLQLLFQKSLLLAGRIQPIPERFSHIVHCKQSCTKVKHTPYSSGMKAEVLRRFWDKSRTVWNKSLSLFKVFLLESMLLTTTPKIKRQSHQVVDRGQ